MWNPVLKIALRELMGSERLYVNEASLRLTNPVSTVDDHNYLLSI